VYLPVLHTFTQERGPHVHLHNVFDCVRRCLTTWVGQNRIFTPYIAGNPGNEDRIYGAIIRFWLALRTTSKHV
jgi:hypothetical protein